MDSRKKFNGLAEEYLVGRPTYANEMIQKLYDMYYDEERFISRSLSGSYSLKPSDNRYDEYITELIQLFNKYQKNGYLKMHNKSVVYIGSVK